MNKPVNGAETKAYAQRVFENPSSTQHQKLDALYQLNLQALDARANIMDRMEVIAAEGQGLLSIIKPEHRRKVGIIVGGWASLVTIASIERIWSWIQSVVN